MIEGHILAEGYLHDPEKTANAFVEDPYFGSQIGSGTHRMYKTGDLAYYSPKLDGSIIFAGRKDHQVKLRGQRFELGEVEHHLENVASIAKNVAAALFEPDPDRPNNRVLAAFFHIAGGESIGEPTILAMTPDLRTKMVSIEQKLSNVIPAYMVPTLFVPMSSFPTNAAGKTDRRALVALLFKGFSSEKLAAYSLGVEVLKRAASTTKEVLLQTAWSLALGINRQQIGVNDNFLRVGGDSLGAMRLASEARALGLMLTVSQIIQTPTLTEMAAMAVTIPIGSSSTATLPFTMSHMSRSELASYLGVADAAIEDAYPCTPLQTGLIALTLRQPFAYTAREVFRLAKGIDLINLRLALNVVSKAYPILRTTIVQPSSNELLQVVRREVEFEDVTTSLQSYLDEDRDRPMAYGDPLWRFALVHDKEDDARYLCWTAHHSG